MADELTESALRYHRIPRPGKIEVVPTKPLATQRDLSLAYSPGVAAACNEIVRDPATAAELTARANLVAVVTNGTAVLGLGAIGPLAAKPVMEGKGVLFKKFAGIDVFDIELAETDQEKLVDIVAALEPTFGGINLEDIKAPECFYVEQKLRERLSIPVFHDDQHGTAIIVGAAVQNGLALVGKDIAKVKLVVSGAGAAALSCLGLLEKLGLPKENIWVTDIKGVVWKGRNELMDPWKERYARETPARSLAEVIGQADIFLGLSAGGVLKKEMVAKMAAKPLILALANPDPEITPEDVAAVRDDAIVATGRSDYPNQVNNVLCFPYIFRGALDVGAKTVNDEMKIACVRALASLAHKEPSEVVARAFGEQAGGGFGANQIIPKPFDPRLIVELAPAVARAAMDSGVATRPITDFEAYRQQLNQFVFKSGLVMRPVFEQARANPKRVIFSAGEDDRVLRAVQIILDEGVAQPILIGRPEIVRRRAERLGLRFRPGVDAELIDPSDDPRYDRYWGAYHQLMERRGVTEPTARNLVRTSPTLIAALAVRLGDADAMIAGTYGRFRTHFAHVRDVIGTREGVAADGGAQPRGHADPLAVHRRHLRQRRARRRYPGRHHPAGGRRRAALRHPAQGGADLAFELRQLRPSLGAQDGGGGEDAAAACARPRGRRRDAWRCRARSRDPQQRLPALAAEGLGQPGDLPVARRGQHRLQPAEERRRRPAYRADAARHRVARACADLVGHRPRHPQHDGAFRRRSPAPGRGAWLIGG